MLLTPVIVSLTGLMWVVPVVGRVVSPAMCDVTMSHEDSKKLLNFTTKASSTEYLRSRRCFMLVFLS